MAIEKVLFEKLYTILTLLMMRLFPGLLTEWRDQKDLPLKNMSDISYSYGTLYSYTLPKEDTKNI